MTEHVDTLEGYVLERERYVLRSMNGMSLVSIVSSVCWGGWGYVMSEQHCPSTLLLSLLLLPYSVNSDESPSQLLSSTDSLFAIYQHRLVLKVNVSGTRSHLARGRLELHGGW